ncbi:MAG: prepilin-type N-terminal cleavage/methylation domain-containing protein [Planctomycetes bacterium]|nr:prepilin-type N-terminal cleavage/methylation domain-containing protein [Planctomycetota bacterium]
MHAHNRRNSGFTLIELMVVVGIIAVLVTVIMVALLPALMKSRENATRTLLTSLGSLVGGMQVKPNKKQFDKDAGATLSAQLDSNREKATSQLLLFYVCPSRDVWAEAPLYKSRDYQPQLDPAQYKDLIMDGGGKLQYFADAWGTSLWYGLDKTGELYLISAGEDMTFETPDDLIYDGKADQVWKRDSAPSGGSQGGMLKKR